MTDDQLRHVLVAVFDDPLAARREVAELIRFAPTPLDVGYAQVCDDVTDAFGTLAIGEQEEDLVDRLVELGIPVESALHYSCEYNHNRTIVTVASGGPIAPTALSLQLAGARLVRGWYHVHR
jgi:hypothetical protein